MQRSKKTLLYIAAAGIVLTLMPASFLLANVQGDPDEAIAYIQDAFSRGDAQSISAFGGSSYIGVSVFGATTLHSRAQTAYILKAFFRDHPPAAFSFQQRIRVGRDWYLRGTYWYKGKHMPCGIELAMHWNGVRYEIKNIRIKYLGNGIGQ